MKTQTKKLINLALQALANGELTKDDHLQFSRDHRRFKNQELTLRELLETIRHPKGDLKKAMIDHYAGMVQNRVFK